jgi:FAD/FMN-containing dehydrogenase
LKKSTKRKYVFRIAIAGVLLLLAIPAIFILSTYLHENKIAHGIPKGYTDDASGLDLTKVDTIISASADTKTLISQLQKAIALSKLKKTPISLAGARHSMGGQTMYKDGIVINMLPFKGMKLDETQNILTVGSGALWRDVLQYLNKYGKSVAIMQAFSSFSIGGSISVNCHGWQHNSPPVSASIISFTLMDATGNVLNCSRTQNEQLFHLVIGGYGLFGIILEIKLSVVNNENLNFREYEFESKDYLSYFDKYVNKDKGAQLVFGRLNVSKKEFLEHATLNIFKLSKTPVNKGAVIHPQGGLEIKRLIFRSSVNSEYGKRLRWDLETHAGKFGLDADLTRNELLNDDVSLIENKDTTSTDILEEYFIPQRHFNQYISALKKILPNKQIDLLNITIRNVYKDNDSYMRYARENVFGFVFLFNQKKNDSDEIEMKKLTQQLANLAITMEGTYYLPYRLHISKETMRKAYPQSDQFFNLKLKYDPEKVFSNKFYEQYK